MKQPSRTRTAMIISMVAKGERPRPVTKSASAWVSPMTDSTKFRKTAARMISMIIAVVRMVPSIAARSMDKVSVRLAAARPRAATTPRDAASVGVAMPA